MKITDARWFRILHGMWTVISERHIGLISSGVAFWTMFSIFPGVAALISLFGFLADPVVIEQQMQLLAEFVPQDAYAVLQAQVRALLRARETTLGWTTAISLGAALWTARLGVAALMRGLNAVAGTELRAGVMEIVVALLLTLALIAVGIIALASLVVVPVILAFAPVGPVAGLLLSVLRWAIAVGALVFGIGLLYRYGPNTPLKRAPWLSPGLVLSVVIWAGASVGLSFYLSNFGNYNEIYGSIGAVIALLMWLYLSAYAVLVGFCLNTELGHVAANERRHEDLLAPCPDEGEGQRAAAQ
ncbi:YihY/virulence factor BrkB family protein [Plastorhodobacter daqingensis]|uniref:YihY/virulence factor BrkB family protein n=1 Tax=Plastorhodobacter daqingensis TaxID=1387281 RepID=A0ABW2UNQ0_9RHOB